ncbi:MAG: DUF29 domain-containing protein [Acetobacteraceae bacterium]|nr:DUF29 domain-containing protein [Acetobacteraceae bacterium]
MRSLYDSDLVAWSVEQAIAIREAGQRRVNAPIDWENVAEEIESLGKSERLALRSRIGSVIEHLLKLQVSPATEPERLWRETIRRTRGEIADILKQSPSLRREVAGMAADQMVRMRALVRDTMADYGETPRQPLDAVTFDEAKVLGDWLPDRRQSDA